MAATDPNDPYSVIRRRATQQVSSGDAGIQDGTIDAAPFDANPANQSAYGTNTAAIQPGPDGSIPTPIPNKAYVPPPPGAILRSGQQPTDPVTGKPYNEPGATAFSNLNQDLWQQSNQSPQAFVQGYIARKGLVGHQTDATALRDIAQALQTVGVNATLDSRSDQYHKGLMINGSFVKMLDGNDNWIWQTGADQANGSNGAGASGSASASSTTMPAPVSAFTQQIRDLLMQRVGNDMAPVDENASQIAQPYGAAKLAADRTLEMQGKANAESAYAEAARGGGALNPESLTQKNTQMNEQAATGLAGIKGQLIVNELQARRSDLNNAMQQALTSGDTESARSIQMALSELDAQLRREGYGVTLATTAAGQNFGAGQALT